jgi:hypothetical protein
MRAGRRWVKGGRRTGSSPGVRWGLASTGSNRERGGRGGGGHGRSPERNGEKRAGARRGDWARAPLATLSWGRDGALGTALGERSPRPNWVLGGYLYEDIIRRNQHVSGVPAARAALFQRLPPAAHASGPTQIFPHCSS